MTAKMDEMTLRRKCRSLETMLTRERNLSRALGKIADGAVKALEEVNNAEIKKAIGTFREVIESVRAEAAVRPTDGTGAADSAGARAAGARAAAAGAEARAEA